jgi:hypothetical protein
MDLKPKGLTYTKVINFDSMFSTDHNSSCDFSCQLPSLLKNVTKIHLVGGNIPFTSEPFLFLDINELKDKKIHGGCGKSSDNTYFAILRYPLPATSEQNLLDLEKRSSKVNGEFGKLSKLCFKIYNRFNEISSFGISKLIVANFDNLNPAQVHTTQNHTLVNGDEVYVQKFRNGSSNHINAKINNTRFVIQTTGVNQFTLTGLDLTGEAVNSGIPDDGPAYPLGGNAFVTTQTGISYRVLLISAVAPNKTSLTLARPYHIIQSTSVITVSECDNCATDHDNTLINRKYTVRASDFDITRTILTLPLTPLILSSYVTPAKKTGSSADFPLGQNSEIWVIKRQVSFDIKIKYRAHDKEGLYMH